MIIHLQIMHQWNVFFLYFESSKAIQFARFFSNCYKSAGGREMILPIGVSSQFRHVLFKSNCITKAFPMSHVHSQRKGICSRCIYLGKENSSHYIYHQLPLSTKRKPETNNNKNQCSQQSSVSRNGLTTHTEKEEDSREQLTILLKRHLQMLSSNSYRMISFYQTSLELSSV